MRRLMFLVAVIAALAAPANATAEVSVDDRLEQALKRKEAERRAAEWNSFNNKVEREQEAAEWDLLISKVRRASERNAPDKDVFRLEPPQSWKWWDDQHTTAGKALRGRFVRYLKSFSFMEDASDLNLWFAVTAVEAAHRLQAKVRDLEAKSPDNAPFAPSTDDAFRPGGAVERFELWTECKPLRPVVAVHNKDDLKDDTFEGSVRAAVESRLRGARIYGNGDYPFLSVKVHRSSGLFQINVDLRKRLFDPITGMMASGNSSNYGSFGSGPPEYTRSILAEHLDKFIADYLRVNEAACGKSN